MQYFHTNFFLPFLYDCVPVFNIGLLNNVTWTVPRDCFVHIGCSPCPLESAYMVEIKRYKSPIYHSLCLYISAWPVWTRSCRPIQSWSRRPIQSWRPPSVHVWSSVCTFQHDPYGPGPADPYSRGPADPYSRGGPPSDPYGRGPPPADQYGQEQPSAGMLQQGSVLMLYGINMDHMNCTRIFNLFCLYGNVVRVSLGAVTTLLR